MNNIEKLTAKQRAVGYVPGNINAIALLGLIGESGEVMQEASITCSLDDLPRLIRTQSIVASEMSDMLKKQIRDKKFEYPLMVFLPEFKIDAFDKELSHALYYLNALAINRGKSLNDYAKMMVLELENRDAIDITHGADYPGTAALMVKEAKQLFTEMKGVDLGNGLFAFKVDRKTINAAKTTWSTDSQYEDTVELEILAPPESDDVAIYSHISIDEEFNIIGFMRNGNIEFEVIPFIEFCEIGTQTYKDYLKERGCLGTKKLSFRSLLESKGILNYHDNTYLFIQKVKK